MNKINYRRVSNILSENEMKHITGGCGSGTCMWCCTVDTYGTCAGGTGQGWGSSCDDCWRDAEFFCTPNAEYGIWIQCK